MLDPNVYQYCDWSEADAVFVEGEPMYISIFFYFAFGLSLCFVLCRLMFFLLGSFTLPLVWEFRALLYSSGLKKNKKHYAGPKFLKLPLIIHCWNSVRGDNDVSIVYYVKQGPN